MYEQGKGKRDLSLGQTCLFPNDANSPLPPPGNWSLIAPILTPTLHAYYSWLTAGLNDLMQNVSGGQGAD
jgi:hypothetical protein